MIENLIKQGLVIRSFRFDTIFGTMFAMNFEYKKTFRYSYLSSLYTNSSVYSL